ncbi:TetR/AcrR family transcriptional regulator [bacterium]|nr:TetR/AcrR family transcriptional regulator [bacterium]
MPERINRRDVILDAASGLFLRQGYSATSIRQIADQAGVTEAAIYYHFKDGKRALLRAVTERNTPTMEHLLDKCEEATSLYDLLMTWAQGMAAHAPLRQERFRWLMLEFPQLDADERAIFHHRHMRHHGEITRLIQRFVADEAQAHSIAWLMTCAALGYAHLFISLDLQSVAPHFWP